MRYIFDPETLQEIAKKGMDLPYEQMFETVRTELEQKYPGRINDKIEWIFNNAGGCMYSVAVLHASVKEYILIFGSPIGTQGHTGRHFAEIYDFVIDGELWYFSDRLIRFSFGSHQKNVCTAYGSCLMLTFLNYRLQLRNFIFIQVNNVLFRHVTPRFWLFYQ